MLHREGQVPELVCPLVKMTHEGAMYVPTNMQDALSDNRMRLQYWQELFNQKGNLVAPLMTAFHSVSTVAKEAADDPTPGDEGHPEHLAAQTHLL